MKKWKTRLFLIVMLPLMASPVSFAQPRKARVYPARPVAHELGSREAHPFGILVGVFSEPIPSVIGISVAYNLNDYLRVQGGWGGINLSDANYSISANTIAGEAQLMVPGMNFSPVGLVGLGYFTSTITGHIDNQTAGLVGDTSYLYFGGGFDWQTDLGFTLQLQYKYIPMVSSGLPGIAVGWFF